MQALTETRNGQTQDLDDMSSLEDLIKRFYSQHVERASAEAQLQQLQKSQAGWQVADTCLASADSSVRFFGALTFTIKLNQNQPPLSENNMLDILSRLLAWTVVYVAKNDIVVLRKLYSALVLLFHLPNSPWSRCIRITAAVLRSPVSFAPGQPLPIQAIDTCRELLLEIEKQPSTSNHVNISSQLAPTQFRHLLTFASVFAEDMGRGGSQKAQHLQKQIDNMRDAITVLQISFDRFTSDTDEHSHLIFPCYTAWINYAENLLPRDSEVLASMFALLRPAMELLPSTKSSQSATEFFTDIFASHRDRLSLENIAAFYHILLDSEWGQDHIRMLHTSYSEIDDDLEWEQTMLYGKLALAFAQHQTTKIFTESDEDDLPDDEQKAKMKELLQCLTRSQTFENGDSDICEAILDFWDNFLVDASTNNDHYYEYELDVEAAETSMLQAIEGFCIVSRLPIYDQRFADQDTDDALHIFRVRARDTVLEAYFEYGSIILRKLVDLVLEISPQHNLLSLEMCSRVEPPLYYLETLSDSLSEIASEDAVLAKLFDSPIYVHIVKWNDPVVPLELKKLAISTIRVSKKFFVRHEEYLSAALSTLSAALDQPDLSQTAASLIAYLCDWNRHRLMAHLGLIKQVVERYYHSNHKTSPGKRYLCGALASLIQGLPSDEQKSAELGALLQVVEQDFQAEESTAQMSSNPSTHISCASSALSQLSRIARACQAPDDVPIDLEAEPDNSYWRSGGGSTIQTLILTIINTAVQIDPLNGILLEESCMVFKNGYTERNAGPFVFNPSVTTDFVNSIPAEHPRADIIVNLACSFISSHSSDNLRADEQARSLLVYVSNVLWHLGHPRNDPYIAAACMDFLGRLVPTYVQQVFSVSQEELLRACDFSIQCLKSPETIPRRYAASFWESILQVRDQPSDLQSKLDELVAFVGPSLTSTLVHCFGGDATRNELDRLTGPFRELISRQKSAKQWIQDALEDPSFPSDRISVDDKRFFLQQVMSLRGSAQTKAIVKDFWVACRGTLTGYG